MRFEPTTIASVARLVGETLQSDYGIDPQTVFAELQVDTSKFQKPGARITFTKMTGLWQRAVELTQDPEFGLKVGGRVVPGDFFVLGHAWLASDNSQGYLEYAVGFELQTEWAAKFSEYTGSHLNEFLTILLDKHVNALVRETRGVEAMAACGQLGRGASGHPTQPDNSHHPPTERTS